MKHDIKPMKLIGRGRMIEQGKYRVRIAPDKEIMSDLVKLTGMMKDDIYLEIGTARGKSFTAVYDKNPDIQMVSIDPAHKPDYLKQYNNNPRVVIMKNKSNKAIKHLKGQGIEASVVYIDGDHTYKWVEKDIWSTWEIWNGKGFLGGHDYTRAREKGWGVIEAVREFFHIKNDCRIDRRFKTRDGVLHISDTFWFFILDEQMHKYEDYLKEYLGIAA